MNSRSIENIGLLVLGLGALLIGLGGAYFYELFQTVADAGTGGSTSSILSAYNSMMGIPIMVTLTIFGFGMLIIGGVFVASAHITEQLAGNRGGQNLATRANADNRPYKMCIKCGNLLYQNSAYCPNCGNPIAIVPKIAS